MHLADLVSHILAFNLTALHAANDCEIPWEEDYRNREGALAAGKTAAAAEGGKGSEFHLVVEARPPDLRRGLYARDVMWKDGGDDGGGRWLPWERSAYCSHNYLAASNRARLVVERISGR
jgi:hypothetical protein